MKLIGRATISTMSRASALDIFGQPCPVPSRCADENDPRGSCFSSACEASLLLDSFRKSRVALLP